MMIKYHLNILSNWLKMVDVVKNTIDIYCFAKIDMKQRQTPAFQAASVFFETNREIPAFFFQNFRKFL